MKNEFDKLLQKQMDRRDFLKHVGIGFAALTGIAAVLKTLNNLTGTNERRYGYGGGAYGGDKQKPLS